MKPLILLGLASLILLSCSQNHPPLQTVTSFQPEKYAGQWHEIARLPNRFEKNIVAAKATYGILDSSTLSVRNDGLKADGTTTNIEGSAKIVGPGKLKVRFDRFPANLFAGDYWVLWINEPYTRAIVGSPSRSVLWLLSKSPSDQVADFALALPEMKQKGFAIEQLIRNPKRLK